MALVMAAIFLLSHTPGNNFPAAAAGVDKLCHAVAYATLGATFLFALHPRVRNRNFLPTAAVVVLFCLLYGITDEFHQSFIPGRFPSRLDIVADTFGGLLSVFCWQWWRNRRRSRMSPIADSR